MEEKKGLIAEFKTFIMRGNVIDMAVGVVIATAFGAITTALVNNIIMPVIGVILGGIDLGKLNIVLKAAELDAEGNVLKEAVTLGIGTFIQTIINFIIIALVIFLVVKGINKLREIEDKKKGPQEEEAPTTKTCPFCKNEVPIDATRCGFCTSVLPEEEAEEAAAEE